MKTLTLFLLASTSAIACSCGSFGSFSEKLPNRADQKVAVFTAKVLRFDEAPAPTSPPVAIENRDSDNRQSAMRANSIGDAKTPLAPFPKLQDRRVVFQTLEVFSGPVKGSVDAFTPQQSSACGLDFIVGETYLVERLNIEMKTAYARPVEANYYTEARENSHILILATKTSRTLGKMEAYFGEVVVTNRVMGYRRKKLYSEEVLENEDLELPEQTFETEAFWFTVPSELMLALVQEGTELGGSIHAIEHAAIGMMPLLSTCDRWDVGGVSHPEHPDTALPTIFIYDGYPGGVGIAEATYHGLQELLNATYALITDCPCAEGCPSCIQSPKCGNNNEPLDKRGAQRLLEKLLGLPISTQVTGQ